MARYIDADKIPYGKVRITMSEDEEKFISTTNYFVTKEAIDTIPTADVVEVKHGHWECIDPKRLFFQCSNCNSFSDYQSRFCSHCGSKMVEEIEK